MKIELATFLGLRQELAQQDEGAQCWLHNGRLFYRQYDDAGEKLLPEVDVTDIVSKLERSKATPTEIAFACSDHVWETVCYDCKRVIDIEGSWDSDYTEFSGLPNGATICEDCSIARTEPRDNFGCRNWDFI